MVCFCHDKQVAAVIGLRLALSTWLLRLSCQITRSWSSPRFTFTFIIWRRLLSDGRLVCRAVRLCQVAVKSQRRNASFEVALNVLIR